MAKTAEKKTYPDNTLQRALNERGIPTQCMWEIPGPKDTAIAWITAYNAGGNVIIVQTYSNGNGWQAYLPVKSIEVGKTIEATVEHIKMPRPVV